MEKPNINNVTDRRGSSPKRSTDVKGSTYPIITQTLYRGILNAKNLPPEQVNQKTRRLCYGRIKLMQTIMAVDTAIREFNPQTEPQPSDVHNGLRSLRKNLEKALLKYPLVIE